MMDFFILTAAIILNKEVVDSPTPGKAAKSLIGAETIASILPYCCNKFLAIGATSLRGIE